MKDHAWIFGAFLLVLWLMTSKPEAPAPLPAKPQEVAVPAPEPLLEAEPRAMRVTAPKSVAEACVNERDLFCRRETGSFRACLEKHREALMADCRKALNNTQRTANASPRRY